MNPSLPSPELLKLQSDWLADARARILRNAEVAKRKRILDLGSGYGFVVPEIRRRSGGPVIALDVSLQALSSFVADTPVVCADAVALPFADRSFDLVFSQNVLLWASRTMDIVRGVSRILSRDGTWVLFEPDYGGMMEYPPELETGALWIQALHRAGADPFIGRKLPPLLSAAGFMVRVELLPRLFFPHTARFDFLEELLLTPEEQNTLREIKRISGELNPSQQVAHLPYYLIIADHS